MTLVHLHNHGHNSTMDGFNSPTEIVKAAKALGQPAVALTDHGTLSGHRELQAAAAEAGIKPIIGLEAYISPTDRFDKRAVKKREDNTQLYNHIIILAKNQNGFTNLNRLSRLAWKEGFYSKPRIDFELLKDYGEDLILLSGCMNGLIAKALLRGEEDEARRLAAQFKKEFGSNFYMEVQPHNPPELNHALLTIADGLGIKAVATSDSHFAYEKDRVSEEAMLILSTNPKPDKEADFTLSRSMNGIDRLNYLYPERPISFAEIDVFMSTREQAEAGMDFQGIHRPELYDNTLEIADKIGSYAYHKGLDLLPKPKTESPEELFEKRVWAGLKKRGKDKDQVYIDRIKEEIAIINSKGFATYCLIIANMVKWVRSQNIFVGPGRGSAVGCACLWALYVTEPDPIVHGLLFFRFINPERNDFPDVDLDFEVRGPVLNYLRRTYGHVANIGTFTEFSGKNVIRDAARVYQIPLDEVNSSLKGVDAPPNSDFLEVFAKALPAQDFNKKYPEVLKLAKELQGKIRSTGMHASGVVVSNQAIEKFAPIETRTDPNDKNGPRVEVVALDMDAVAEIGLIKLDILGLDAMAVIHKTLDMVKERHNKDIDIFNLPLTDDKVYADISNGFTRGLFQVNQPSYTNLCVEMKPSNFDELTASNALVRPGAMKTIGETYLARKEGRAPVKYLHERLEPFTKDTYGCILYQEQVMLACVELGGMTMAEADKVRKIIGKKKDVKEFDQFKDKFVSGASLYVTKEEAENLWHDFEAHAGYSFNKSHAVAYSMVTYWTAWLKHYYPLEFMTAMLQMENDTKNLAEHFIEVKRLGIRLGLPHVNLSGVGYSLVGNKIQMGLSSVKYISDTSGNKILEHAPYDSYAQLLSIAGTKGSGINSRAIAALDAIGGAAFEDHPRTGNEEENYYEYLNIPNFDMSAITPEIKSQLVALEDYEQTGTFVSMGLAKQIKTGPGWARVDFIDSSGSAGIFTTPDTTIKVGTMYLLLIADNSIMRHIPLEQIKEYPDDVLIKFLNKETINIEHDQYVVVSFKSRRTKAGQPMATIVIANRDKEMKKVMVFSTMFHKAYGKCREGAVVRVSLARTKDDSLYLKEVL